MRKNLKSSKFPMYMPTWYCSFKTYIVFLTLPLHWLFFYGCLLFFLRIRCLLVFLSLIDCWCVLVLGLFTFQLHNHVYHNLSACMLVSLIVFISLYVLVFVNYVCLLFLCYLLLFFVLLWLENSRKVWIFHGLVNMDCWEYIFTCCIHICGDVRLPALASQHNDLPPGYIYCTLVFSSFSLF